MASQGEVPDHIRKTLDEFRQDASKQYDELLRSVESINMIERRYGLPLTSLAEIGTQPGVSASEPLLPLPGVGASSARQGGEILFDRYLGLPPLAAAKQYIEAAGHAVHLDEVADAVRRGGAATKGVDWKDDLRNSLTRSTSDVVKVQDNVFGLTKFYTDDQLRGLRSTRPQAQKPKKKRGRPAGVRLRRITLRSRASASPEPPRQIEHKGGEKIETLPGSENDATLMH